MDKEKVANLFRNKEFLKELFKLKKTSKDMYKSIEKIFQKNNVELTIEEIEEICDIIDVCTSSHMVLGDDDLDNIIGGVSQTAITYIFNKNINNIRDVINSIENNTDNTNQDKN